jgi:hypothetical protein
MLPSATTAQMEPPIPPKVESSIDRGLEWLARNQERDGSWTGGGTRGARSAAVTGLAAMAFMARGHVPGQGKYGETLNRAIDFVLSVQQPDGLLAAADLRHPMYDHGICSVMLCEAYGMLDERRQALARTAISRSVRAILQSQNIAKSPEQQGGWRYELDSADSDLSVTGWQIMALRGAANAGANIPPGAISAGISYIKRRANRDGSFNYQGGAPTPALTGTGVLTLILLDPTNGPNLPEVKAGGDYLLKAAITRTGSSHFFYTIYYVTQAAWQLGGRYWTNINNEVSNFLVARQNTNGSWEPVAGSDERGGESYCTAMAILALAVPYRYLPIYQR